MIRQWLLACVVAAPAVAQTSATVTAGGMTGHVDAGQPMNAGNDRHTRTSDTRHDCKGVTVRSGDGSSSSSASVSTSGGGSSVVVGGGSPGSHTSYYGCDRDADSNINRR